MLNKVLALVARVAIGKKFVGALGFVHNKLDGKKSEIVLGLWALVHGLKLVGVIPPEAADSIEDSFKVLLPVTLADRASKVMKSVDSVAK